MLKRIGSIGLAMVVFTLVAAGQTTVTTSGGTTNAVPKFTGSATVGNSAITEVSGSVGIGTTSPISKLDITGGNGSTKIFSEIATGQPDYSYYYLKLFVVPTGGTGNQLSIDGNVSGYRSDEIGVSISSHVYVSRGWSNSVYFSQISNEGGYSPFQLVQLTDGGQNWVALLYDAHTSAGIASWVLDLTVYNEVGTGSLSLQQINSTSPIHSALSYIGKNTVITEGNVGIGTTTPGAKLEVDGNVKLTSGSGASITFPDSTVQSTAWTGTLTGGDYAESMNVAGSRAEYEPGDVLVLDADHPGEVEKSATPYSTLVAGVYSTKPGVVGRRQKTDKATMSTTEVPMAMIGVVPMKVSAANGSIHTGDLLVASSTAGYAMKGTDQARMMGAVIGKALDSLDSGTGVIEVLISLQ